MKYPRKRLNRHFSVVRPLLPALGIATLLLGMPRSPHAQLPISPGELFSPSTSCQACHNGLVDPGGEDVSIGVQWRASVMANSSNDPYWRASVRRETMDHPKASAAIEDQCATCHMPMDRFVRKHNQQPGTVFQHLPDSLGRNATAGFPFARDGVSCTVCHQIENRELGEPATFSGEFRVEAPSATPARRIFGPYKMNPGNATVMSSATGFTPEESEHIRDARLCASCHTLYTHAFDENGNEVSEFPEQMPFLEWLHSDYADAQSCQECHMPEVSDETPISSVLGIPRNETRKHVFRGGNTLMLSMLGQFSAELNTQASSAEFSTSKRHSRRQLQENAAELSVETQIVNGSVVEAAITVNNYAGHKLPTAFPSRRVWLEVQLTDLGGTSLFHSGKLKRGAIEQNDNDMDANRFEPHYEVITDDSQVQIYEAILGDTGKAVTTGLTKTVLYLKDNRILPGGFDKTTASGEIAVHGMAIDDPSFDDGADTIIYRMTVPPSAVHQTYRLRVKLWYQPIGYRWAENLSGFNAREPRDFTRMYRAMTPQSTATVLTETSLEITGERSGEITGERSGTDTDSDSGGRE